MPDLDHAISEATLDCMRNFYKTLIEFGETAKVRMTVHVEYEPVNSLANKKPFEHYLSAALTCIFKRYGKVTVIQNPYIDFLRILTNRYRKFNTK